MPCSSSHRQSTKVQTAGLCCSHVGVDLINTPGPIPPYTKGGLSTNPTSWPHVMVTRSDGKCGTCLIVGSRNAAHPGKHVLKFVPGGPGCPGVGGCCALAA